MSETVRVRVRFITVLQRYSGAREVELGLPRDPRAAVEAVVAKYGMPWTDNLEKSTRVFINKELAEVVYERGRKLEEDDLVVFVPISGGG
jgi:molybdopterin converting factor small subunit